MKAKAITNFAKRFGVEIVLNPELIVEKNGRYYLVSASLKHVLQSDFYVAGIYLGKAKEGKFFPSFNLLSMLSKPCSTSDKKVSISSNCPVYIEIQA